jgi:hypothetical protein
MNEKRNENRLPPPAFPPGQRRHVHRNSNHQPEPSSEGGGDSLIAPDDPMPRRRDPIEQAFISPDDPMPERKLDMLPEFADYVASPPDDLEDEGEGEVVGMDLDAHASPSEVMTAGDPHVAELVDAIVRLGEALQRRGEAGLRTSPEMSRFDTTLRAYCVGYLAGRRAEDPPPPVETEEY